MDRWRRVMLTIWLGAALLAAPLLSGALAARAAPVELTFHSETLRLVGAREMGSQLTTAAAPAACSDRHFNLEGTRWPSAYRWWFRAGSTPSRLTRTATEAALRRAFANIVNADNDCGRADRSSASAAYQGRTTLAPSCRRTDGRNVIGFRELPDGVAARTCWWADGTRVVEADIQISSNVDWATSLASCVDELMLEAVMTHEAGHVFGLGHVAERRHGRLTMSTFLDSPCNNQESTLGLGDLRGLEALYP
jgi:hypothetical protein